MITDAEVSLLIGVLPNDVTPPTLSSTSQIVAVKQWLREWGLPDGAMVNSSPASLAKAYANERYRQAWLKNYRDRNPSSISQGTSPMPRGRRIPKLNLNLNDLDEALEIVETKSIQNGPPTTGGFLQQEIAAPAPAPSLGNINYADIARAADEVISTRLNAAKADLWAEIQSSQTAQTTAQFQSYLPKWAEDWTENKLKPLIIAETNRAWAEARAITVSESEPESEAEPNTAGPIPTVNPNFYFDPIATRTIKTALKLRRNLFISGPTGCGKTDLVRQVHAIIGKPILRVNMHGDVTSGTFLGKIDVKAGETIYTYGALPTAIQNGWTLLIDEIDYTPPHIAAVLNPVLERSGALYIPETNETIKPKSGFCVIATANSGGKGDGTGVYTGVEVLNTAFLDRFSLKINMDYLPFLEEAKMIEKRFPAAPRDQIAQILNVATEIRKAFQNQQLSITLSTRKVIEYFDLLGEGYSAREAVELVLINWLDDDDRNLVEAIVDRVGGFSK